MKSLKKSDSTDNHYKDEEELDDVLKYLELEQHFSTNPVKSM
jgi:hypothetical protein